MKQAPLQGLRILAACFISHIPDFKPDTWCKWLQWRPLIASEQAGINDIDLLGWFALLLFTISKSMRHFVQSAGMSYKPNFRKCTSTAQRSNGKGSKWLTRVDDQGGYEAPLRMAMADNAALQRKGVKGKGKSGEGKEGKGLGKRSKGKGARLPLTDLVPEPDPEQKFIMVGSSEKTRMLHTDLLQASQDLLGIGINQAETWQRRFPLQKT